MNRKDETSIILFIIKSPKSAINSLNEGMRERSGLMSFIFLIHSLTNNYKILNE